MTLPLLNATMLERWGGPAGGITLAMIAQSGFFLHQALFLQQTLGFIGTGTLSRIAFALLGNR